MSSTHLIPKRGILTMDDLERLAFAYGGSIELGHDGWWLRGATFAGASVDLGPVK